MTSAVKRLPFALGLIAALSTAIVQAQSPSPNTGTAFETTTTPVAHVYVTTSNGINVYSAASTGKLTLVTGSPFKGTSGLAIGTAGNHFITIGTNYVHSYALTSTGGIGKQVSQLDTRLYAGAECGPTYGGSIDRTGNELYVQMQGNIQDGDEGVCDALQTFKIDPTTGALLSDGTTYFYPGRWDGIETPYLTIAGNNRHAYTVAPEGGGDYTTVEFYRDGTGALNTDNSWSETDPVSNGVYYQITDMAADNQNTSLSHMAAIVQAGNTEPYGPLGDPYLTTYTIDSYGNIATNNALLPSGFGPMQINPQGNVLVVGGVLYHFNGGNPITPYGKSLASSTVKWDKYNHAYAINQSANKLYVYTITPTSFALSGTYTLSSPSTLAVR